ncbi:MAG: hexitol phosphatase HxpB [Flavobacteriales bacterium]|jgi:sugar-phosphatase|nr:hexitol phosphatase HxpB [Flavobacteriales bacterium]
MLEAVIFDMDGVLIDSEPLWKIAEVEGFAKVGLDLTHTDCEETVGLRIDEVVKMWHRKVGWTNKSVEEVSTDIVDILIREIHAQGKALEGVHNALETIKSAGLKIGLATSSDQRIVDVVLDKLEIATYFDAVHSAQYEIHGKPHPAVFMSCAEKLEVSHLNNLVIEDSFNGIIAAKAARMKVIGIPEKSHQHDPRLAIADVVLDNLNELNLTEIRTLWE